MRVLVKYSVGYGDHETDLEFDDDATDEQIAEEVRDAVMERLEWSWKRDN